MEINQDKLRMQLSEEQILLEEICILSMYIKSKLEAYSRKTNKTFNLEFYGGKDNSRFSFSEFDEENEKIEDEEIDVEAEAAFNLSARFDNE